MYLSHWNGPKQRPPQPEECVYCALWSKTSDAAWSRTSPSTSSSLPNFTCNFQDIIAALVPTVGAVTITQHYYHHKHQLVLLNGSRDRPADTQHTHTHTHHKVITIQCTLCWNDRTGELIGFNGRWLHTHTEPHTFTLWWIGMYKYWQEQTLELTPSIHCNTLIVCVREEIKWERCRPWISAAVIFNVLLSVFSIISMPDILWNNCACMCVFAHLNGGYRTKRKWKK